jgi:hypothetical protein
MNQVIESANRILNGTLQAPEHSGFCLQLARIIIEDAYGLKPYAFYNWLTHPVERDPADDREPWARDMERSLKNAGMAYDFNDGRYIRSEQILNKAEPGSLLFRWDVARSHHGTFIGHVGILLDNGMVLENIHPRFRKRSFFRGSTAVTPLKDFPTTTVINFDINRKPNQ